MAENRSPSIGITGHVRSERPVTFNRNQRSTSSGIRTRSILVGFIVSNSNENRKYAQQIAEVLISIGWRVETLDDGGSIRSPSLPRLGLNERHADLPQLTLLAEALQNAGLNFEASSFGENEEPQAIIDVGVLPANDYQAAIDKFR